VVALVVGITSAAFYMRAFNKLEEKSGVSSFKTAGVLYLVGTLLSIVLIGGILVWLAWIFAAWGFHSLKPLLTTPIYSTQSATAFPYFEQNKRCPNCGTDVQSYPQNAEFCGKCGARLRNEETRIY
jgi:hypothetical protein